LGERGTPTSGDEGDEKQRFGRGVGHKHV
jgi:hypothetical protein